MTRAPLLALAALLALARPGPAQEASSHGPLHAEEASPLYRLAYTPNTEGADLVEEGRFRIDAVAAYSNIFEWDISRGRALYLDLERLLSSVIVRRGLSERWEAGGRLTFETSWEGFLDGFIHGFHETFGLPNSDRERFPQYAFGQSYEDERGVLRMEVGPRRFSLDEVRLFGKWKALEAEDGSHLVSARLTTRIPAGENLRGDERTDLALALLGRRSWDQWHLHGMAGATTLRSSPGLEPLFRDAAFFYSLAVERRLWDGGSALVQLIGSSPYLVAEGSTRLSGPPGNLVLGLAGRAGESWRWEISFAEDVLPPSPSVDFTAVLSVGRGW